jgi:hypothetical protein
VDKRRRCYVDCAPTAAPTAATTTTCPSSDHPREV